MLERELEAARARIVELEAQLHEVLKLSELQKADLGRYREAYEAARPNHPERVPVDQLQLAFAEVLASLAPPVNDASGDVAPVVVSSPSPGGAEQPTNTNGPAHPATSPKKRHPHGRRPLADMSHLETKEIEIIPPEVLAAGGVGFVRIGEETSSRIAFRPAAYMRLIIHRYKYVRVEHAEASVRCSADIESSPVGIAPVPDSVWPNVMADPSAIAHVIISKYDDILPLHRQEKISARDGFVLPRSTQCGWLRQAHAVSAPIVEAMFQDAKDHAFCIATDATGAPMRASKQCQSWDVFVCLADRDHVVFRYTQGHATSDAVRALFSGFRGHLLADAAPVYDALFESGDIIEHCCWYHCRRYFYRALETDRERALAPLSLIAKLFELDGECATIVDDATRTQIRAERSKPLLELLDKWVERHRHEVDPRGPLDKAIGYYTNQREALHRFVEDARISLHNNFSEQQLRNLALGRHNWNFFANEAGLRWYTTFRSLIASCRLHALNAELYLERVLRLAPHWPRSRVLELAPKYWNATFEKLDASWRAIITRPWENPDYAPRAHAPPTKQPLARSA
jgi:transposase